MVYRVQVDFVDGDYLHGFGSCSSTIEVEADSELAARLLAHQMVSTPMPGKPDHIQIVGTRAVCVS